MPDTPHVEAVEACILAGGLSSRMGQDKSRMRLGGKSLLSHVRATVAQAGLPMRVIRRDLVPGCGPLGGVYTALQTSKAEAIVFLSCDMPFVNGPLLEELRSRLVVGINAVFTVYRQVGFPLILRRAVLPEVKSLLAARQLSLHFLARTLNAAWFELGPDQALAVLNVNTPEDFRRAQKLHAEKGLAL